MSKNKGVLCGKWGLIILLNWTLLNILIGWDFLKISIGEAFKKNWLFSQDQDTFWDHGGSFLDFEVRFFKKIKALSKRSRSRLTFWFRRCPFIFGVTLFKIDDELFNITILRFGWWLFKDLELAFSRFFDFSITVALFQRSRILEITFYSIKLETLLTQDRAHTFSSSTPTTPPTPPTHPLPLHYHSPLKLYNPSLTIYLTKRLQSLGVFVYIY